MVAGFRHYFGLWVEIRNSKTVNANFITVQIHDKLETLTSRLMLQFSDERTEDHR